MKKEVKVRRAKPAVTVEDLYTREELNAILQVCTRPQDKAMIEVLHESACRVGELVSMTFENIKFMTNGVVAAIVSGKTGTRTAFLFESVKCRLFLITPSWQKIEWRVMVVPQMVKHTLTDVGIKRFLEDREEVKNL